MKIRQFDIWIADLEPQRGTETGKVRPVLIVQTNLLREHPSTIVCPITTNVAPESDILRVHLKNGTANLKSESDIMIDQIRAIDNRRLTNKVGELPQDLQQKIKENIKIVLDLE
ncbi:MAG: taxon MazF [Bacteroidetes bacterium GWE2_41_25]|nr:MAG: taxon MazF [Bacteroidetes bacterium GWA2_40_15]OFX82613.1 MAG: taxon MazF [Bacteroidetes bacterium GWC2_40_22]OFX99590.1 MAG: taxon MazF [Bacteroidetes bacterium GWE2_41_25]OFY62051.1 MAG: taxon MazF [Bacteroidetes bacterium GWF2_41_9]HBQ83166.1 type II toxin-antitoxin system PemK/MazF family toxin [Bacteroidales bacterium]